VPPDVPIPVNDPDNNGIEGDDEMPLPDGFWADRLAADRDRHSTNATSLEKILEMQYAGSKEFRDATAGRIVLEAGSGRTRAETNWPANTSAQPSPGGVAGG
jgi:hypothetical protein